MKIETPQILWHNGSEGNGKPAPLYTVSILPINNSQTRRSSAGSSTSSGDAIPSATTCTNNSNAAGVSRYPREMKKDCHEESVSWSSTKNANDKSMSCKVDILATAGNSTEIHIWKIQLTAAHENLGTTGTGAGTGTVSSSSAANMSNMNSSSSSSGTSDKDQNLGGKGSWNTRQVLDPLMRTQKPKIFSLSSPSIQHLATLTRHERSINALSFSPNGNHLASAGDGGALMVHTVPSSYRFVQGERNSSVVMNKSTGPDFFWKNVLQKESDLSVKVLHTGAEDVMDISWSSSSDKFIIGTLDHSVLVYQENFCSTEQIVKTWNCIWKNNKEHTHYVQGVAYDPLGVYLASQGSDRTVRVWQRKGPKSVRGSGNGYGNTSDHVPVTTNPEGNAEVTVANQDVNGNKNVSPDKSAPSVLATRAKVFNPVGVKFDVEKAKILKYRMTEEECQNDQGETIPTEGGGESQEKNINSIKKRHLFADESTVESFFRRLAWTADGAFLMTPASIWHKDIAGPSFATLLFTRHQFEKPYKVFHGLDKPSVVIRSNPVLFQLPNQVPESEGVGTEKVCDNHVPSSPFSVTASRIQKGDSMLPYRSIFAVLTVDSILIYDTFHSAPLCIARNLHYAGLTDCSWSPDGHHLVVSSTDGYISIISFERGELGDVYVPTSILSTDEIVEANESDCSETGDSGEVVAPPTKKIRSTGDVQLTTGTQKKRITPILVNSNPNSGREDETQSKNCPDTESKVE